jgi:peptide/nickel transport system ATP-binding protein/oligopeptide transport system ATP-binding protein
MGEVGMRPEHINRYPHEFSGGQRQRIGIARALALNPKLIICDEPVSALDASIQGQVINLLQDLQERYSLTYLFISHDLSLVEHISDRVAVMYLGRVVEISTNDVVNTNPLHPYTNALISASPIPNPKLKRDRIILRGDVPSALEPPVGCHFHLRCPKVFEPCDKKTPELKEIEPGHFVRCFLYE